MKFTNKHLYYTILAAICTTIFYKAFQGLFIYNLDLNSNNASFHEVIMCFCAIISVIIIIIGIIVILIKLAEGDWKFEIEIPYPTFIRKHKLLQELDDLLYELGNAKGVASQMRVSKLIEEIENELDEL